MTLLGIYNPNSLYNRSAREAQPLPLPISKDGMVWILECDIRAVENLRTFHYMVGNLPDARLHAMRLGKKRAELRQLKAGKS